MGLENIRNIKFRYIILYKKSGVVGSFFRTLEYIEKATDFPLQNIQIIYSEFQKILLPYKLFLRE